MDLKKLKYGYYKYFNGGDGSLNDYCSGYIYGEENYTIFSEDTENYYDILDNNKIYRKDAKYGETDVTIKCDLLDIMPLCVNDDKDYGIEEILLLLPRKILIKLSQAKINQQELITNHNINQVISKLTRYDENEKSSIWVEMIFWRDDGFDCYDHDTFNVESKDPSKISSYHVYKSPYTKFRFTEFKNGEENVGPYIYFGKKISYDDAISMLKKKACTCATPLFLEKRDRIILKQNDDGKLYIVDMDEDDALALDEAIELYKTQETKDGQSKIKKEKLAK